MSITRSQLGDYGGALVDLMSTVDSYEAAVRGQVTAISTGVDAIGSAWSGPLPAAMTERAKRWVGEIYETGNIISGIQPILFAWAQSAWNLADDLPESSNDPDLELQRAEVAAEWRRACTSHGDDLAEVLGLLERSARADIGGPFDAFGDMLDGFGDFFGGGLSAFGDLFAAWGAASMPTSWADWMRGPSPHREDLDLALLADDAYDVEGWNQSRTIGNGWKRVPESELPAGLTIADFDNTDLGNGMTAALYTDGDGHYVLAFAGTDGFSDALTDIGQATGLSTKQYAQARSLTTTLSTAYGGNLVLTGHSLGGGLAAYGAVSTGSTAVTFNAAGLSDAHLEDAGLHWQAGRANVARTGQVRAYHVDSDILTNSQEAFEDVPDAIGAPITIANPVEQPTDWSWLVPPFAAGLQGAHAVDMHLMSSVLSGMQHSDLSFTTTYQVETSTGTETRYSDQTYPGGWFS